MILSDRVRRSISHIQVMPMQDLDTLDALAALLSPSQWSEEMFERQPISQFLTQTLKKGDIR